jgi:hypothetical protein
MAVGPGKYDLIATMVREMTSASGVVILVFDGAHGSGFSVQGPIELTTSLPKMLRGIADDIDKDLDEGEDDERRDA